jgi:hypothetical protein
MGVSDIGGRAHSPQLHGVASPLVEASHQKHAGVDDTPGKVTAECGEEHGPNLDAVCGYDAQGQGEGKRHYQAKQDFRNPVHRLEDSIGQFGRKLRRCVTWHFGKARFAPSIMEGGRYDFPISLTAEQTIKNHFRDFFYGSLHIAKMSQEDFALQRRVRFRCHVGGSSAV